MFLSKKRLPKNKLLIEFMSQNKETNATKRKIAVCKQKVSSYLDEIKEIYVYLIMSNLNIDILYLVRNIMFFINSCIKRLSSTLDLRRYVYILSAKCNSVDSPLCVTLSYFVESCACFITYFDKALRFQFKLDNLYILFKNGIK